MRAPSWLDAGWVALAVATIVLVSGVVILLRPLRVPYHGPTTGIPPAEVTGEALLAAVRGTPGRRGPAPSPFGQSPPSPRGDIDSGASEVLDVEPSYLPPPPRIVGTGRRPDGIAFIGCEPPGGGIVIVREGGLCGIFRFVEVRADSARFSVESSDTVVVVALVGRR